MKKRLAVNLAEMASAMDEPRDGQTRAFLDRESGDIEYVPSELEDESLFEDVLGAPHRFVQIEPLDTWQRLRVRARFAEEVSDPQIRLRLGETLDAPKGQLGAFDRELRRWPGVRDAWFRFRERALAQHARAWLAGVGVEAVALSELLPPAGVD